MRLLSHRKRLDSDPSQVDAVVERPMNKWKCFKSSAFWLLFCGVLLQGLGGFVPGTYLPCESGLFSQDSTCSNIHYSVRYCDPSRCSGRDPVYRFKYGPIFARAA